MTETLNNFASHHLQNDPYHGNNLNQTLEVSLFHLALVLILILLLILQTLFILEFFMRLEVLDLLANPFSFTFVPSISPINSLSSDVVKYFVSMSDILAL